MNHDHYEQKSTAYGIGHTRLRRILNLAGDLAGKKAVDAGCARGYLGSRLKDLGAYVIGLEVSGQAAAEASKILDEVYVADLEKSWPLPDASVDLVVLAEVLEHVFDPVKVLREAHRVLNSGGSVIITTPNFMTWTNRARFLVGNFKYQNQGMFDFGHIRWFTYAYLKKVLSDSGFVIEKERHIIFPGKLTKFLKQWPGMFAFQFVLKAHKT